jgi:hypothetical protein
MDRGGTRPSDKIRAKIDAGALPREAGVKVRADHGRDEPCSACDEPIRPVEVVYEIDLPGAGRYRFHTGGYGLWEADLLRRGRSRRRRAR